MKKLLACLLVVSMSGCPEVRVDLDEVDGGPTVEFDPGRTLEEGARFIPFPNDLARDPATGLVNLPPQACESETAKLTRELTLNKLDGFGTFETAMQVTFTEPVDPASLTDRIAMYQLTKGGTPLTPTTSTTPVPVRVIRVGTTPRFSRADCDAPELVSSVTLVPLVPLDQKSTYFVVLLSGITDTAGVPFTSAYTWELVKLAENPVTVEGGIVVSDRTPLDPANPDDLASLLALARVWDLHAPGIAFFEAATGQSRQDLLVAFQFTTQTVTDPLDPSVAGSPASEVAPGAAFLQPASVTNRFGPYMALCGSEATDAPTQCFLKLALGGCSPLTTGCTAANYAAGATACQLYSCAAIGDVIGAGVLDTDYQVQRPNPLPGGAPLRGAWNDPVHPDPQGMVLLETIIVVPAGTPPANGWPTVQFSHGLTSSKESVFAIAGRLAATGFATVAIDIAAHGSRAARISTDPAKGCIGRCFTQAGTATAATCDTNAQCGENETCGSATATPGFVPPSPTTASQCYAPFLSPDLAATRDAIRQTVLDQQRIIHAIKSCTTANACGGATLDGSKISFTGFSLGGFIAPITAAMSPDINVAVINAGGVGWADFLENTETLAVRCLLVDGLIDAGILQGTKWDGGTTGLCTTDEWKMQPGFQTFAATGRWVLDPADGANFAFKLAPKHLLIQEIVGDTVIPNVTTNNLAALVGMASMVKPGDPFNPGSPAPSAAITAMPAMNKFVTYTSDANTIFAHPSFLRPVSFATPATNATARLQVDASTFLFLQNQ